MEAGIAGSVLIVCWLSLLNHSLHVITGITSHTTLGQPALANIFIDHLNKVS
jgi:hypothetical protein